VNLSNILNSIITALMLLLCCLEWHLVSVKQFASAMSWG